MNRFRTEPSERAGYSMQRLGFVARTLATHIEYHWQVVEHAS
ncbi:hypothetical protein RMSM_04262 [Rhodopirellula maiorica SM1]|uniref:Uncharacterized protein n=1 Tax=Rhodopirellula maiorica SM1 TaxID=1265738 RepID=M5RY23_9BACT|nr:hypothetical protein RMSM_04262 [Rhodopirellula maiorica SM1]